MTCKIALLGGAALSLVFALNIDGAAHAKPARHRHPPSAANAGDAALKDEVRELKAQVNALQAWRDAQVASQTQSETQLREVRAQLAETQARATAAETQVATRIETIPGKVQSAVAASAPKSDKLYIKGVSLTLGGFVEAASIYRSRAMEADISSNFNAIPFGNNVVGHTREFRFSARQSRISGLIQGDVAPDIHLAGYGEFDFQGAAQTANSNQTNSYNPRIRHLYTTIDWDDEGGDWHLLAGQTWSLATTNTKGITPRNELIPSGIEGQFVPGFVLTRQPQLRLTRDFNKTLWVAVSLESPQTTFFSSGKFDPGVSVTIDGPDGSGFNSANTLSLNQVPDVVGKVALEENLAGHDLHLEAFGIYRDLYERVNNDGAIANHNASAGGVGGAVVLSVVPKVFDLQISGIYGSGIGRYAASGLPDATLDTQGFIHPIREEAALIGAIFHAGSRLDIYLYAGGERQHARAFTNGTIFNGLGNVNYVNTGCDIEGSMVCVGNTRSIEQLTAGFWHKPYQGSFGRFEWGVQYSYTERHAFEGIGETPSANENMIFTSIRYYPF